MDVLHKKLFEWAVTGTLDPFVPERRPGRKKPAYETGKNTAVRSAGSLRNVQLSLFQEP